MKIIIGISLIIIGSIIRIVSIKTLKKHFSLQLKQPDEIVTSGIYRLMRHPSYFGSLLIIAGASVLHETLGIILVGLVFFFDRIVLEESIMPISYLQYKEKVGMFFPKFWRRDGNAKRDF